MISFVASVVRTRWRKMNIWICKSCCNCQRVSNDHHAEHVTQVFMSQLISRDVQLQKSYGFISEATPSPSSRLPPEAAACCYVSGCRFSLGWHSDAHAGQVGGKHCDPEDQPRYRRGLWHSHPESVRPNAQTGKVSYCLSAPEERIH